MLLLPTAEKQGLFFQQSRPGLVSLSSPPFFVLFRVLHWWEEDMLLSHNQEQGNRSLQQFLAFGGLRRVLRLVLCGLFQPQMAGWDRAVLLWEGECVLLTEAFITLAAGTSGGGEVLLCGVGLVRLHLTLVAGLNCG